MLESLSKVNCYENTIINLLNFRADNEANKVAYIYTKDGNVVDVSITYKELKRKALILSEAIKNYCQVGDRIILIFPSGIDFIVSFLDACMQVLLRCLPIYLI